MIDLSESFDVQTLTEQDLWQSETSLKTSGRNKYLFGWPFTTSRNGNSPYALLRNDNQGSSLARGKFETVSDTSLVTGLRFNDNSIPDFKFPKFIPIYDTNKLIHEEKVSFNASHPVPWFDIEASCIQMEENNNVADLSKYLAEGKLYPINKVSKKKIKKLESRSNTNVNLHEAYSNEDVMDMYKMMTDMKEERQKVMKSKKSKKSKKIKPLPSSSSTSLSLSDLSLESTASLDDQMFRMKEKTIDREKGMPVQTDSTESFADSEDTSNASDDLDSSVDKNTACDKSLNDELDSSVDRHTANETSLKDELENSADRHADKKSPLKTKPSPRRFGVANERHCEAVANLVKKRLFTNKNKVTDDEPIVDLYVELADGRIRPLCHIKAGMANLCLNTFFFPCTNIASVTWVPNIQETVLRKVFKKFDPLKDIFGKHISRLDASDFAAVLFLSKSAKDIIKHKDLCMIDTLSVTLGIRQGSLLLLNMDQKPEKLI